MRILLAVTIMLTLFSCSENEEIKQVPPFEDSAISVTEKMKIAISKDYLTQIGLPDTLYNYLKSYYSERGYSPQWINDSTLTQTGNELKSILKKSYQIGIPQGRLLTTKTENYIQDEINLTVGISQAIGDLKSGIIDYKNKVQKPKKLVPVQDLKTLMVFDGESDLRYQFLKFGPKDTTYDVLGKGLIKMIDQFPMDTSTFAVKSAKFDTLLAMENTRVALISKGYIKKEIKDSAGIIEGLTRFQIDNGLKPDGVIGKYTSQALNESTFRKVERIMLAMDKIRTRERRPEKYIWINIPEYKLYFYINDSLKSEHNIVAGKFENQTPELNSKLNKIVVYPYWNVPYSISSKEILPSLKHNPDYLEKHNYKLLKKDSLVDPLAVNWKKIGENSFPYKVRQEPGPKNSLGIIKFDFNNVHSVYFHDTPAKGLFGADVRAYSHGCMRTQNPVDLAKAILERDEYRSKLNEIIPDSLDTLLQRGKNYEIKILDPIPIFIEYQTATRFKEQMITYLDIYGRDEEYLKIMRN